MSIEVTISLEIESFDRLKSVFDAAEDARVEAGITARLYRNIDAPNNAWVISTVASKEVFGAFFSSSAQQERMKAAGVTAPPIITFLESS